ncbi:MAG: UDP-N-acetylglucosamine 2-epimerase (non-hydrolyzing) [Propionibacteriaceae bacterium]|nr:UDP-N-acetylglucosamine 2-epimerase (non-hydrolyzing) [Propionibacteriaceae bacterium]
MTTTHNNHPTMMVVYGTRPEAIKCAPLIRAFREAEDMNCSVVLTGQHPDMVAPINAGFGIHEDANLDIFAHGQSLSEIAGKTMTRLAPLLHKNPPAAVFVQGDTTSAMAAGLAAFYEKVPVVHVEAGLRTESITSPFPEEGNRRLLSQIATLHLAATEGNRDNLLACGIPSEKIIITGNPVIDALRLAVDMPIEVSDPTIASLITGDRPLVLVTSHRRESWGDPMREIAKALRRLAIQEPETYFVFPMHANPAVREFFVPVLEDLPNVILTEPLGYFEMAKLMARVKILLTDSGGLQEEGPALGKPVLVLREDTERPEGVAAGTAELVGHNEDLIVTRATALLHDAGEYARMAHAENPYGDGTAAHQTLDAIRQWLAVGTPV